MWVWPDDRLIDKMSYPTVLHCQGLNFQNDLEKHEINKSKVSEPLELLLMVSRWDLKDYDVVKKNPAYLQDSP